MITLITCTYNAESVLQRTLDSVMNQTYPDIEHIIIDGRSKDSTVAMAEEYKLLSDARRNGHSVVVQSEPDKGLYDAMNKGIKKAKGEYLCFLNAGDKLADEHTIENIVKCCEGNTNKQQGTLKNSPLGGWGAIYGETDIVDDNGTFLRHRRLKAPEHLTWRSFRMGMLVCHQSFYANTEIAKKTLYNLDYKISADVDWCIRIMKTGKKQGLDTLNTHIVLCHYLDGGMSIKNHRASLIDRFKIMMKHYGILDTIMLHLWFVLRAVLKK